MTDDATLLAMRVRWHSPCDWVFSLGFFSRIDEFDPHRNIPISPNLVFSCLQIVINTFTTVIINYAFETEEKVFGISVFHDAMN